MVEFCTVPMSWISLLKLALEFVLELVDISGDRASTRPALRKRRRRRRRKKLYSQLCVCVCLSCFACLLLEAVSRRYL
jgi:hypothetical protein